MFTPIIEELGTINLKGQDFSAQRLSYGSRQHIYIFRKGELHRHGLVFQSHADYEAWKICLKSSSVHEQGQKNSSQRLADLDTSVDALSR